ncbi:MAG: MFS transporter, partial [Myxococcota bacterium]
MSAAEGEGILEGTTKRAALLTAATASFLTPFMGSSVNLALPSLAKDLHIDAVVLSWVPAAYLLAAAVFLVPVGRLADIHGRKRLFLWGLVVFTVASALSALAPSAGALIAFRFAQGVGSAMIFGTGMAILSSVYPPHERGRAFGITVAAVYFGLSAGPVLGGLLAQHLGWRSVFASTLPLGALAIAQVLTGLKGEWAEARGEHFDAGGSIIYGLALLALILGLSLLPEMLGVWVLLAGVAALAVFLWWEMRHHAPVLDTTLFFRNRVFAFSNLAALINYSATFSVVFLLSLYLQYVKGLSPQQAGFVLIFQPVVMAVFSPFAGRLSDKIEPRVVASIGMGLTTVALFLLSLIGETTGLVFVMVALMVLGLGIAFFSSPNANAVMGSVDRKKYGVASGTVGTMRL